MLICHCWISCLGIRQPNRNIRYPYHIWLAELANTHDALLSISSLALSWNLSGALSDMAVIIWHFCRLYFTDRYTHITIQGKTLGKNKTNPNLMSISIKKKVLRFCTSFHFPVKGRLTSTIDRLVRDTFIKHAMMKYSGKSLPKRDLMFIFQRHISE